MEPAMVELGVVGPAVVLRAMEPAVVLRVVKLALVLLVVVLLRAVEPAVVEHAKVFRAVALARWWCSGRWSLCW